MNKLYLSRLLLPALIFVFALNAFAQQGNPISLTAADYERAEKFLGYNTGQLVDRGGVRANWLPDERFWYRVLTAQGSEFILVNPANGTRAQAFDHAKLAAALSSAGGQTFSAARLPFMTFDLSADGNSISFAAAKKNWKCDIQAYTCAADTSAGNGRGVESSGVVSPDKKRTAYIKNWNL